MRWLRATWVAASRTQKVVAALAVLIAVGAAVTVGRPGTHPAESPAASSPPPDSTAPTLAEVRQVPSSNPGIVGLTYTFSSDETGSIQYGGDCTSDRTAASAGNNPLTFAFLRPGPYADCTIQVTDAAGNRSAPLAVSTFTVNPPQPSIARIWNEALLSAIRVDRARPPVQARNLFHASAAMYDIWAAYEGTADTYLLGHPGCPLTSALPPDRVASEKKAISYAMYRLIVERFSGSPGLETTTDIINALMAKLGYDPNDGSTDF